jgi:hypothetical protein
MQGKQKTKEIQFLQWIYHPTYSEVEIHGTFSFQLGFSMTVHKAQGRTIIDKVVLDLYYKESNHRKRLGLGGIFVALSRVRCCSSITLIKLPSLKKPMDTFQDSSQLLLM